MTLSALSTQTSNFVIPTQESGSSRTRTFAPHRRRTIILVAVIWFACGSLYLLPYLIRGGLDLPAVISHFTVSSIGLAFSIAMLAFTARLRRLSALTTLSVYALTVIATAATLASVDIAVFDSIYGIFGLTHGAPNSSYSIAWAGNFAIFMSQFSLIAVAFWSLDRLESFRQREVELEVSRASAAEARGEANKAKLSALRYQLNPHFLFNTLNSISSLVITRRRADAELMLTKLSDFLRATLSGDPDAPQTLEGEFETIDAYLGIERIRFGDRLAVAIDCPPELRDARMPHFLLQPLVENAVKHGVAPSERTVTIGISARARNGRLIVSVENDCPTLDAEAQGTGVGLRNVRERLTAVYGKAGNLETIERDAGFIAIVSLPLEFGQA